VAVGGSSGGIVVPIINGIPGSPQVVPGTGELYGVACSDTTTCVAVGGVSTASGTSEQCCQGVVVPIINGSPGTAQVVSGTSWLYGVDCPTTATCEAVGVYGDSQGEVVPITNGVPGSSQAVTGAPLHSVACPTATNCEAVGNNQTDGSTNLVAITNGIPGSAQPVAGTGGLWGVDCPTATICEASGRDTSTVGQGIGQGSVVPIYNGVPAIARAQTIPGGTSPGGSILDGGVACPSAIVCISSGKGFRNGVAHGLVMTFAPQTAVSLTFDNGAISQYALGYQKALAPSGVTATFYVNTGVVGGVNHMSWSQLSALQSAGQEIGGKTVDGTNLTTLSSSQQVAEICNDRQALISHGLSPVGFAYPYGAFNATLESEVQGCGYNNARTAGSLSPAGPIYADGLPPKDWLALRAYAPTGQITLANLESLVTGAASHGNGWVPVVIQKVCSQAVDPNNYATCTSSSGWIDLADLNTFLSWVQNAGQADGAPAGTIFSPLGATGAITADTATATNTGL
jgi:peptidoglycan/xylan/chitin deacetylase (PgdA/CDA1 family)